MTLATVAIVFATRTDGRTKQFHRAIDKIAGARLYCQQLNRKEIGQNSNTRYIVEEVSLHEADVILTSQVA